MGYIIFAIVLSIKMIAIVLFLFIIIFFIVNLVIIMLYYAFLKRELILFNPF